MGYFFTCLQIHYTGTGGAACQSAPVHHRSIWPFIAASVLTDHHCCNWSCGTYKADSCIDYLLFLDISRYVCSCSCIILCQESASQLGGVCRPNGLPNARCLCVHV